MDDKELIKRIMEEVKDEKLREELLALVVEKNKKKGDTEQEEEKPIDYVAKQAVLLGATEGAAKAGWWIVFLFASIFLIAFGSAAFFYFLGFLYTLFTKSGEEWLYYLFMTIFLSIPALLAAFGVFALRSGKREYEKLKRKEENQGQS